MQRRAKVDGVYQLRHRFLARVAKRLEQLLREDPDRDETMHWVEMTLFEASGDSVEPDRRSLGHWTHNLIEASPWLYAEGAPWAMAHGLRPNQADNVHELIVSLIPSEGGL